MRPIEGRVSAAPAQLLDPVEGEHDPARADDDADVQRVYDGVEASIQSGTDRLSEKRTLPVLG